MDKKPPIQNLKYIRTAFLTHRNLRCFLLIFLCFFLTSAGYLSWLYHLMDHVPHKAADLLTMGGGYLLQALGIAIAVRFIFRRSGSSVSRQLFSLFTVIYTVCMIPALLSRSAAGTIVFGLLMNLFCGLIAAFYLHILTFETDGEFRAILFGSSYAAATIASWLLSFPGDHHFLQSSNVLFIYFILAAALLVLIRRESPAPQDIPPHDSSPKDSVPKTFISAYAASQAGKKEGALQHLPFLIGTTVVVFSLVKNIGFGFPSTDLYDGVSLEASRAFYAVGLLIAGYITEKDRKYGAVCTMAALVTPFLILSLSGEPVPQTIFWALDYFVYGFFSVYRIILFSDLAKARAIPYYAGLGLLLGRVGDAAGTSLCKLFTDRVTALVVLAALLFIAAIFLFFRLYQYLYVSVPSVRRPSEAEIFEHFSSRYDLSAREKEVLQLLLEKKTSSDIAEALFISDRTVKFHIHNLLAKTECKNRTELLAKYRAESP